MHVVPLAECSMMTTFRRELLLSGRQRGGIRSTCACSERRCTLYRSSFRKISEWSDCQVFTLYSRTDYYAAYSRHSSHVRTTEIRMH